MKRIFLTLLASLLLTLGLQASASRLAAAALSPEWAHADASSPLVPLGNMSPCDLPR